MVIEEKKKKKGWPLPSKTPPVGNRDERLVILIVNNKNESFH